MSYLSVVVGCATSKGRDGLADLLGTRRLSESRGPNLVDLDQISQSSSRDGSLHPKRKSHETRVKFTVSPRSRLLSTLTLLTVMAVANSHHNDMAVVHASFVPGEENRIGQSASSSL
jgi:hypothetical protein